MGGHGAHTKNKHSNINNNNNNKTTTNKNNNNNNNNNTHQQNFSNLKQSLVEIARQFEFPLFLSTMISVRTNTVIMTVTHTCWVDRHHYKRYYHFLRFMNL